MDSGAFVLLFPVGACDRRIVRIAGDAPLDGPKAAQVHREPRPARRPVTRDLDSHNTGKTPLRAAASPSVRAGAVLSLVVIVAGAAILFLPSVSAADDSAFPVAGTNLPIRKACTSPDGGAWTDKTGAAESVVVADVTIGKDGFGIGNGYVVYGMARPFSKLGLDIATAGTVGTSGWEYWNGAWTALSPSVDGTNEFRSSGARTMTFVPPGDWAATTVDATTCTGSYYFVRSVTETSYVVNPAATSISATMINLKVQVNDELGNVLTGIELGAFTVTGGSTNTVFAFNDLGAGAYEFALHGVPSAGGYDQNYNVAAAKDGFVTSSALATGSLSDALMDRTGSPLSLPFGFRVTSVQREGLDDALPGATVTTGDDFATTCTASSGAYYCPIPLEDTRLVIRVAKDGYVTNEEVSFETDRISATDGQVEAAVDRVQYAYAVTSVLTQLGDSLGGVTLRAGNVQGTTCDEAAGAWYCAVPLADTTLTIEAAKDGYVTYTGTSFLTDRTTAAQAQVTQVVTGVPFAVVAAVTNEIAGGLTGATVTTGNGFGVACTASGSSYYCAVPLAHTERSVRVAKDGFVTFTALDAYLDRTAATDAQRAPAVSGVEYALRVRVQDSGYDISGVTVAVGDSFNVACSASGIRYYCAIPVAHTERSIRLQKDGHVETAVANGYVDRTAATDARSDVSQDGFDFAVKVTLTDELGATLSGATVTAGDGLSISCLADLVEVNFYQCPVPLAHTATTVQAAKDGYVTHTAAGSFTDRTAATDAQTTFTVTDVPFAVKVTVADEILGALVGATVTTGDAFAVTCTASGAAYYCAVPLAHTARDVRTALDGYVTKTVADAFADRTVATDAQRTVAVASVQFAFKVTGATDELAAALSSMTVATGDAFGTACTESGGAWYCPVPVAHTGVGVRGTKPGYLTLTENFAADRVAATDAQQSRALAGVAFSLRITLDTETSLVSVTFEKKVGAGAYAAAPPVSTVGNVGYFAQTAAEADVVYRFSKYGGSGDTGAAFTTSDAGPAVAVTKSLRAPLTEATVAAADPYVASVTDYTFRFTAQHAWPADGTIKITFPADVVPGTPTATIAGAAGTLTVAVAGQDVVLTRAGGALLPAGTPFQVTLSPYTNPSTAATSGAFALQVRTAGALVLDEGTAPGLATLSRASGGGGGGGGSGSTSASSAGAALAASAASPSHAAGTWSSATSIVVAWKPITDAAGYSWSLDGQPDDVIDGMDSTVTFKDVGDGVHDVRIKAITYYRTWSDVVTVGGLQVDTAPPSVSLEAFNGGGRIITLSWAATDKASGVGAVEVWMVEPGAPPRILAQDAPAKGSLAFTGETGKSYSFFAVATDRAGHATPARATDDPAAQANVESSDAVASPDARAALAQAVGMDLIEELRAADHDADGRFDAFRDGNGALRSLHLATMADGVQAFVVEHAGRAVALWLPATNTVVPLSDVTAEPVASAMDVTELRSLRFTASGEGWRLIRIPGTSGSLERVLRADGSEVPTGRIWQAEGVTFVLDEVGQEFVVVLAQSAVPVPSNEFTGYAVAGLVAFGAVAFAIRMSHKRRALRSAPVRAFTLGARAKPVVPAPSRTTYRQPFQVPDEPVVRVAITRRTARGAAGLAVAAMVMPDASSGTRKP